MPRQSSGGDCKGLDITGGKLGPGGQCWGRQKGKEGLQSSLGGRLSSPCIGQNWGGERRWNCEGVYLPDFCLVQLIGWWYYLLRQGTLEGEMWWGKFHKFSVGYTKFVISHGDVQLYIQMQDSFKSQRGGQG